MKKFLGILVLGLLFFSNANAIPKWIGKPVKVCKVNQDIDLSLVLLEEGRVEEKEDFSLKKDFNFIGKKKILKIKDKKLDRRFVMLTLKNSKPGHPLLLHEEPIYLESDIVGKTTSGNYSFNYNKNLSFGYIKTGLTNEELSKKNLYIEIEKTKYPAELLLKPLKQTDFKKI